MKTKGFLMWSVTCAVLFLGLEIGFISLIGINFGGSFFNDLLSTDPDAILFSVLSGGVFSILTIALIKIGVIFYKDGVPKTTIYFGTSLIWTISFLAFFLYLSQI